MGQRITPLAVLVFLADLTWIKNRSTSSTWHVAHDTVRGSSQVLYPNDTLAEADNGAYFDGWNSDGFVLAPTSIGSAYNTNNDNYVSWNFLAGGTASSNTDGTITSSVSANTDAGFSIVSYTGTLSNETVGHGLSQAPELLIIKSRTVAGTSWAVGSDEMTSWVYSMELDTTDAEASVPSRFNSTAPTSSVFSIGTSGYTNVNTEDFIATASIPRRLQQGRIV